MSDWPFTHVHITEREADGSWEDCLWASAVEWARATGRNVPATHAEFQALRAASGEPLTGGSNTGNLVTALRARYGISAPTVKPNSNLEAFWTAFKPGTAAVVQGSPKAFVAGHTLRRFSPDYVGGHAVFLYRADSQARAWWCDPLAPADGYNGQWVSKDQALAFMGAFPTGSAVIGTVPIPAPVVTYTKAQLDAAVAAVRAEWAIAKAVADAATVVAARQCAEGMASATTAGAEAERARIKALIG